MVIVVGPRTRENSELAAKTAIKRYFLKNKKKKLDFKDIKIKKELKGRPIFSLRKHLKIDTSRFSLSISHTDRYTIADVTSRGRLGVDIEMIKKFPAIVYKSFLTNNERKWIEARSRSKRYLYTTLFWSLKEACLKALGEGLRIHPSKIEVKNSGRHFYLSNQTSEVAQLWYNINYRHDYVITKVVLKEER